jgi:hypothetical protein
MLRFGVIGQRAAGARPEFIAWKQSDAAARQAVEEWLATQKCGALAYVMHQVGSCTNSAITVVKPEWRTN